MSNKNLTTTLTACESDRMEKLEASLEYVINRCDGLSYVIDGAPLDEPKMTEARRLLPAARWHWWGS